MQALLQSGESSVLEAAECKGGCSGQKKNCLQFCQPADPWFGYVNIYCAPVEHMYLKILCYEPILISLVFQAGAPCAQCSGLPLRVKLQYPQRREQHTVHRNPHLLDFHV